MNIYSVQQDVQFVQAPADAPQVAPRPKGTRPWARPQYYPVHCGGLSDEARDYLRRQVRTWRREGSSAINAANRATSWACGYRWFAAGPLVARQRSSIFAASAEFVDGWEFAQGEDQYLECMIIDQC